MTIKKTPSSHLIIDHAQVLIERIRSLKHTSKNTLKYLVSLQQIHFTAEESYLTLSKDVVCVDGWCKESKEMADIGSGLSSLAVKMSLNHQKTKETFSDALEQFKVLILSLKDKKKQMKKQAGKRQEEILVVQDKMLKSSLLFEESVSVLKNGGGLKRITCPFILRLELLAIEREAVVQYRNRLEENVKWVQDYIEYETQTLVTYKAIIAVICDSLLLESIIPHDVVQDIMTAVKGESVPGFSSLQDQFAAIPPENLPEIESSVDIDHEFTNIIKSGKLLRPKKLIGWKERCVIQTQGGFVHVFDKSYSWDTIDIRSLKFESIHLMHCSLAGSDKSDEFQLIEDVNGGFFRRSVHVYKMKSEEGKSIQEWWDSFSERVKSKIDGQFVGGSMMQIAELRLEDE